MNAVPTLAIFDFDHTLFRTEEFWLATCEALNQLYGLDIDQLERERLDRRPGGPGRLAGGEGYDLFEHLRTHYQIDANAAHARLVTKLRGAQWLYDGATELLNSLKDRGYTTAILTVGVPRSQNFKRDCCLGLPDDLAFEVVERNKGEYLAEKWQAGHLNYGGRPYDSVILVDDAASTFDGLGQRSNLTAIQIIERPKHPTISSLPWVQRVHNLRDISDIISAQA